MEHFTENDTVFKIASENGDFKPFTRPATIVAAICAIIFSIIGVLGNLVTVIALLKYTRLRRHATTAFVISLSISDLIFSAVNLPLTASRYLNEAWVLGDTLCKIFPLFFYGNVAVSLLSMVAITINRYILISKSDIYNRLYTSRGIMIMLIVVWTLSFFMLLPPLLGIWGTLGLDSATFSCTILKKNGSSPKKFLFVLGFLVPCIVISVSYLCIYWRVRRSRKNLEAHAAGNRQRSGGFHRREDSRISIPGVNIKGTQYLGIPYAQPPLEELRFARPVTDPLPSWNDMRNGTQYAPSCLQVSGQFKLHEKFYKRLLPLNMPDPGFSEDCLYLNIFVPDGSRSDERWPVMVWFHGGDFNTGTPAIWDASIFVAKQKVLVVTVAYRLNIFGFFTTTDSEAPGNYGMFDQIAALEWVKRNIKHFNGAPDNIIIYGHSSGAISVGLHMLSPLSKGKFHKAIAMSGDAIGSVRLPEDELSVVDTIADTFGCYRRPTSALMKCLRRLNADFLIEHSSSIETWGPIVDAETNNDTDPFLPQHPKDILESGSFNAIPLITGYTNNEQVLAYMDSLGEQNPEGKLSPANFETMITDEFSSVVQDDNTTCIIKPEMVTNAVLFFYKPYPPTRNATMYRDRYLDLLTEKNYAAGLTLLASGVARRKSTAVFVYRFDYRPKTPSTTNGVPEWAGVPHMFELPFVWGLPHLPGMTQWHQNDKRMCDAIMTMLATFAKSGDPSSSQIKWEPYTQDNPRMLIIDKNPSMNEPDAVDYKALAFWNDYYPQMIEEATNNCCNITNMATTWRTLSRGVYLGSVVATTAALHNFWF